MPEKHSFFTLTEASYGEYRAKGSKFLAYAMPVYSDQDIENAQTRVRKEHPKARHHCYAWRLGLDQNQYRANDDGEPSGTAGRPILGQIDKLHLTHVIVIVVRYFGGTLLGTSGLIQAYRSAAAEALSAGHIQEKKLKDTFQLLFTYEKMPLVMTAISKIGLPVLDQDFSDSGKITVAIPKAEVEATLLKLKALVAEIYEEEVADHPIIEGFTIKFMETTF